VAQWSGVGEPDDPLRSDDPLVGPEHEDVLLGSAGPEVREPEAGDMGPRPSAGPADDDMGATAVVSQDDRPTAVIPALAESAPPAPATRPLLSGIMAPWAAFAAVALVVIAATSTFAGWLQGPTADRRSATPMLQPVPTATAPPSVEPTTPPPATTEAEPTPEPEPTKERAPRTTQRPRPTRAPAPRPPAATAEAPASATGRVQEDRQDADAETAVPPPGGTGPERGADIADAETGEPAPSESNEETSDTDTDTESDDE
jgi:hypothetical protein